MIELLVNNELKNGSAFWAITPFTPLKSTNVSEEHVSSIFRVEE
jgi:hypothetical protein